MGGSLPGQRVMEAVLEGGIAQAKAAGDGAHPVHPTQGQCLLPKILGNPAASAGATTPGIQTLPEFLEVAGKIHRPPRALLIDCPPWFVLDSREPTPRPDPGHAPLPKTHSSPHVLESAPGVLGQGYKPLASGLVGQGQHGQGGHVRVRDVGKLSGIETE